MERTFHKNIWKTCTMRSKTDKLWYAVPFLRLHNFFLIQFPSCVQLDIDINGGGPMVMDFTDNTLWNKLLHKGSADQAPAAFTSTHEARRQSQSTLNGAVNGTADAVGEDAMRRKRSISSAGDSNSIGITRLSLPGSLQRQVSERSQALTPVQAERAFYERDLFLAMARHVLETLVVLYDRAAEDQLISRILKGLWDFITICEEFGLHQMLNSTVQLLSFRCRGLMDAARRVPTKPFSRRNILANKAQYQQLKQDTGVDLHALVVQDFRALINTKSALHDDKSEHTQSQTSLVQSLTQVSIPPLTWSYASMIRGELLLRVILQTSSKVPYALQSEACSSLLMVLSWARSRGALPSTLALIHSELISEPLAEPISQQLTSPRKDIAGSNAEHSLVPSTYAHRCYLEAYGLALERSGQSSQVASGASYAAAHSAQRNASSTQSSGWLGFLFAAVDDDAPSSQHHAMLSAPAGTLDLPNLYRNTNASVNVDMTGSPLRPDDELLKACLETNDPTKFFFEAITERGAASTESLLDTMFTTLSRMLEALTTTPRLPMVTVPPNNQRNTPAFKRSASAASNGEVLENGSLQRSDAQTAESEISSVFEGVEEENACFPEHMLSTEFVSNSDVKELDAVVLLEWICNIVLKDGQTLLIYWTGLYGKRCIMLEVFSFYD